MLFVIIVKIIHKNILKLKGAYKGVRSKKIIIFSVHMHIKISSVISDILVRIRIQLLTMTRVINQIQIQKIMCDMHYFNDEAF